MNRMTGCVVGWALVLVVGAGVACSSDFDDCAASRSCPDAMAGEGGGSGSGANSGVGGKGGTAGKGGAGDSGGADSGDGGAGGDGGTGSGDGGAGGHGAPAACTTDADCDDGVHCNGVEQCEGELCQAGSNPCANTANPDAEHCGIACSEGASEPICGLEGLDQDGDGHRDLACASGPGDDCNDSEADGAGIHPGADEICNGGVDDDCDGEDETIDEVLLGGATEVLLPASAIRRDHPSIAAMPGGGFGVVWADWRDAVAGSKIYYLPLGADGTAGSELLATTSTDYVDYDYPDLVGGGDEEEFFVGFRALTAVDGDPVVDTIEVKYDGSGVQNGGLVTPVVWAGDGGPRLTLAGNGYLKLATEELNYCLSIGACAQLGGLGEKHADTFHVSPTSHRLVYERNGDLYLREGVVAPSLVTESVAEVRSHPVVTEDADAARIAYRYNESGIRVGTCDLPDGVPVDIAKTASSGSVLLYFDPAKTGLHVRVISSDCSTRASALVADGNGILTAALAVDEDDVIAVVWSSQSNGDWTIQHRVFSPALCD